MSLDSTPAVPDSSVEFFVGPGAVKRAEQCLGTRLVDDRPKLPNPVGKDVATPLYPGHSVIAEQAAGELRRGLIG